MSVIHNGTARQGGKKEKASAYPRFHRGLAKRFALTGSVNGRTDCACGGDREEGCLNSSGFGEIDALGSYRKAIG